MMKIHVVMMCILAACGGRTMADDRTVVDEEPTPMMPPDVAAEQSSDSSASCREGLSACDGECIDLMTDDESCGVCGHACMDPGYFGHCEAGSCPPAFWCTPWNTEIDNCHDACAAHGQRCMDEPSELGGCAGGFYLYTNVDVPNGAIADCENHLDAYHSSSTCRVRIPWTIFIEYEVFSEAVACCCTQDPT